jgi:hypothetical protein
LRVGFRSGGDEDVGVFGPVGGEFDGGFGGEDEGRGGDVGEVAADGCDRLLPGKGERWNVGGRRIVEKRGGEGGGSVDASVPGYKCARRVEKVVHTARNSFSKDRFSEMEDMIGRRRRGTRKGKRTPPDGRQTA